MAVGDEARRQLGRRRQGGRRVLDAVVLFEPRLQPAQDLHGLVDRRLHHVDLLEAPRQRRILLEDAPVLGEGGRADALERARRQRRLEQVARVQRAARCGAGTDQRMDFVDEQDRVRVVLERLQHALEALLEVATVLGAGQQRAHVERIHHRPGENVRHLALGDAPRQPFGDRRLADARLAHQQRIVLAATAQHLHHTLDFLLAADQRIDLAGLGQRIQVLGELLQRAFLAVAGFAFRIAVTMLGRLGLVLADAVADEVDDVQPRHTLLLQVVHGVGVLLAEDGDQHIGARHLLLAVGGRLHVHDGALDHALEAQRRLRVHLVRTRHHRGVVGDEVLQVRTEVFDVGGAGAQHLRGRRVVQQRKQQVLHRNEFVAGLACFNERHVQAHFQFLRDHASSITHCRGWPACRAWVDTNSTFVAAISRV